MKILFLISVFLLKIVLFHTITIQDLLLLKKSNNISSSEIFQCLLEEEINTSSKNKFQTAETYSSLFIPDPSLLNCIYFYQPETAGYNQPKKAILRL